MLRMCHMNTKFSSWELIPFILNTLQRLKGKRRGLTPKHSILETKKRQTKTIMACSRDKGLHTVKKLTVRWKQESMSDRLLLKINLGNIIRKPINFEPQLSPNKCVKFWIIQKFQTLKVVSDFCRISLIFDFSKWKSKEHTIWNTTGIFGLL